MDTQNGSGSCLGFMSKMKSYIVMICLQFGFAGMYIVSVLCLKKGMSHYVLAVYRHAAATAALAPFAFLLERFLQNPTSPFSSPRHLKSVLAKN